MHREFDPGMMAWGHQVQRDHHHHDHDHSPEHDHDAESRALVAATVLTGLLLGLDVLLGLWGSPWQSPFGVRLALMAAVVGGGRVVYLALAALLEGRIGADIALAIATLAAGFLGEYFVAAEVVFIALVGECLEALTFERARRAIQQLLEFRPTTARVIRDGEEIEIPADALKVGDVLAVRPGERIAADGKVLSGRSAIDQSILTGESLPVDKGEGDPVFTGTYNQFGRLEFVAEKVGAATTLGQVITLLANAQKHRSPLERTADRYARLFLPALLIAAVVVLLGTNLLGLWGWWKTGTPPNFDLMPALAVLVVACPCALILATPAAVLATTARLARRGVLVKGGAAIERLARVDALAFDKTGTLTEGRPEIGEIRTFDGLDESEVLRLAATAERPSEHPLARLLVATAAARGIALTTLDEFEARPGAGVSGTLSEGESRVRVLVGNLRLMKESSVATGEDVEAAVEALDLAGQTTLLVAREGRIVGAIGARDRVRREAHDVIHELKHLGLKDITILTGDRPSPAMSVAKKVHVKQVEAGLSPAGKADWVQKRREEGRVVAMIGDGVNDAPALALADVGLAIGGVGADIAAEAGSIVLMGDPLEPLPEAVRLSRQTVRVIRQNILIFAFGLNALAVLLAGFRLMGPVVAAIFHQIGSLLVLLNAIRLLGFERWGTLAPFRFLTGAVVYCRTCHPSSGFDWLWRRRSLVARGGLGALAMAYLLSGLTVIGPAEVGALQRWGKFQPPLLQPGLHLRWPSPVEQVTKVEPDLVRLARVGGTTSSPGPIAWGASHGAGRDESSLFLTGDENLVELSAVVEYRLSEQNVPMFLFHVASVDACVLTAAEGAFREAVGLSRLDDILATRRSDFEAEAEARLSRRLADSGLAVVIERVRVIDAHPPREVVPSYRDVSAAVSDASRYRNEAEAYAAGRKLSAMAEAQGKRDSAAGIAAQFKGRAEGERQAFVARASARAALPELTEFRLLYDTLGTALAGRPKILLDPSAGGRRHLWLTDPNRLGLPATIAGPAPPPFQAEPED